MELISRNLKTSPSNPHIQIHTILQYVLVLRNKHEEEEEEEEGEIKGKSIEPPSSPLSFPPLLHFTITPPQFEKSRSSDVINGINPYIRNIRGIKKHRRNRVNTNLRSVQEKENKKPRTRTSRKTKEKDSARQINI
ncbi:unnamed protein product [Periconia digitata]|uniref:Uncharacterized protein n=1 Tax=Periconia digitata TaxID=1303443 RepID=A0A9W4UPX7_9PLEO|nr:unnamed protein product [Periconia digitata]